MNEKTVIGRLLAALSKLNHPADKRKIVIVEDGPTDKTPDICMNYAKQHKNVTILHSPFSNWKPSASNYDLPCKRQNLLFPKLLKDD